MAVSVKGYDNGSIEIEIERKGYFGQEESTLFVYPDRHAEFYAECGNCTCTNSTRIDREDLVALRDALNEALKD